MNGQYVDAAVAFRNCAALKPDEPNSQDSLADALLASGNLARSRAAFTRATELSKTFFASWHGLAVIHFFQRDWANGFAKLKTGREAAKSLGDQLELDVILCWVQLAKGDSAAALATLAQMDKRVRAQNSVNGIAQVAWQLALTQDSLGQKEPAEKTRKLLVSKLSRDPLSLYVWSRLSKP